MKERFFLDFAQTHIFHSPSDLLDFLLEIFSLNFSLTVIVPRLHYVYPAADVAAPHDYVRKDCYMVLLLNRPNDAYYVICLQGRIFPSYHHIR